MTEHEIEVEYVPICIACGRTIHLTGGPGDESWAHD